EALEAGIQLQRNQCYWYKIPPVLGGDYTVENTSVIIIAEHYRFFGDLYYRIKDLTDGSTGDIKIVDLSALAFNQCEADSDVIRWSLIADAVAPRFGSSALLPFGETEV